MIRPRSVKEAVRIISKSCRSPSLRKGRIFLRRTSPTYAAAHCSTRTVANTTKGLSIALMIRAHHRYPRDFPWNVSWIVSCLADVLEALSTPVNGIGSYPTTGRPSLRNGVEAFDAGAQHFVAWPFPPIL